MAEKIGLEAVFVTTAFDAGLRAYTAGLHTATRVTATASNAINFMGQIAIGAARRLGELAVNGLLRAGHAALRFGQEVLRASLEGSEFENTMGEIYASLVNVTRVSFAPFFNQFNGFVTQVAPKVLGVVSLIQTELGSLAPNALIYGRNLVAQFAQGMWDGMMFVFDALAGIGNLIASWLAPGSPPRILPDIDQWGTDAMNEWLAGWGKADFNIFKDISSTIESLIRSTGSAGDTDLIPRILGSREGIAQAVDELRTSGQISEATMDGIIAQVGTADAGVRDYLESVIALQAANEAVADAQADLNRIMAEYDALLEPIDDALAAIDEEQLQLAEDQEKSRLQLILQDPNASASAKRRAALRLEQIDAERARRALLAQKAEEVDAAEDALDAATEAQQVAQDQFDSAQAQLEMLSQQNQLLEQQIALLERLAELGGGPAPRPPAGGGAPRPGGIFAPDMDFAEALRERVNAALEAIRAKVEEVRTAWGNAWDAFNERMQPVYAFINDEIVPLFNEVKGILERGLADAITIFLTYWNDTLLPDLEKGKAWIEENVVPVLQKLWVYFAALLPVAVQIIVNAIVMFLIPEFIRLYEYIRDNVLPILASLWIWFFFQLPVSLDRFTEKLQATSDSATENLQAMSDSATENLQAMSDTFTEKLQEISDTVTEKLQEASDTITEKLNEAGLFVSAWLTVFQTGFETALGAAKGKVDDLLASVQGLWNWLSTHIFNFRINLPDLPDWAIPGSPTPLEIGLRGIAAALREVDQVAMHSLGGRSSIAQPAISSPSMLGGGSQTSITNAPTLYYQPQYSTPARGNQGDAAVMLTLLGSAGG